MSRWDPDWVMKPGEFLKEWIDENGMSTTAVAAVCGLPVETIEAVLDGSEAVTVVTARRLEKGTNIPVGMWMNLQRIYQEGMAAGKKVFDG